MSTELLNSNNTQKRETRTYVLAQKEARRVINLKNYADLITNIVHSVIPNVLVTFTENSYTVHGICRGEAIRIGKLLSQHFSDAALLKAVIFISTPGDIFVEENLPYNPNSD